FNNSIDGVAKQAPEVLGQFLSSIGGSITQVLQSAVDGPVSHALVACAVASGRPVVPVRLTGSYKAYRASLIGQLLKTSGVKKMSRNAIQREVSLALRRLQILGEPMNATVSSKFLVMIDEETIKGMPKGLTKNEQAKWLAGSIRSADEIENLNLSAWRERIDVPGMAARAGKAIPFVGNLLAGLFQLAAYRKVSRDLAGSMKDEKIENQYRLGSAAIAIGATIADIISQAAGAMAETTLFMGRAVFLKIVEQIMDATAKRAGVISAGMNSFWDGKNSIEAFREKNFALGTDLGVSAISGAVAAGLIAAGSGDWAIVATFVLIGSGIVAPFLHDNNIDKWLKRCYWGILDAKDCYQNAEIEMSELSVATKS
ncbi:MAG TPA: hypothetical protein VGN12_17710, partial [Pirellulales bacterium]